jgi:Na+-transporting NADH:ubiquinone oxidoreductase subunit NqrB
LLEAHVTFLFVAFAGVIRGDSAWVVPSGIFSVTLSSVKPVVAKNESLPT